MAGFFAVVVLIVAAASYLGRGLMGGDKAMIARKLAATGGKPIWIKRTDAMSGPSAGGFGEAGAVTFYDVLVERDGVRRIEVWRVSLDGAFQD